MRSLRNLTDPHLAILGVLWDRGNATIAEIHAALQPRTRIARKTVATLLTRLEGRGLVKHRQVGLANVYSAAVKRRTVLASRLAGLLGAVFEVEPSGAAPILDRGDVKPGDVARIRALLRKAERTLKDAP